MAPLPAPPFLYPILDLALLGGRDAAEAAAALGAGGARIVQLRAKGVPDREFLAAARRVREATRSAGVLFVVNDRADVARIVGADGVHVGQDDLDPRDLRALLPAAVVGVSTH